MGTRISLHHDSDEFADGMTLDDKIEVFRDRVEEWQLNIAEKCWQIPHSGFAVLHIVVSYFESMAKYIEGYTGTGRSKEYFKKGFYAVFPDLLLHTSNVRDTVLENFYDKVRCALYHGGMTLSGIFITGKQNDPVMFDTQGSNIFINPGELLEVMRRHFRGYCLELKKNENTELREKFKARFDCSH